MDIDIVLLWVDGSDPRWLNEYHKFSEIQGDMRIVRYRDWDNLQYLFRAFEVHVPWIRKIHFVTWGHLPNWLDTNHPKLNVVYHQDYINSRYLPVFNANPLEINIHNIDSLAEHFIFFNDDFFITKPLSEERFFQSALPCDMLVSNALSSSSGVGHLVLNNLEILNRNFNKKEVMKQDISKWFNPQYGFDLFRNLALLPWPRFTGFVDPHQPQPFLKSTFQEVWEKEKEVLERTSASKFRACSDVNQYLFRYWQLAKGTFAPISMNDSRYVTLNMLDFRSGKISDIIISGNYSMVCLNDSDSIQTEEEFDEAKKIIKDALKKILPNKSDFEI